MRRLFALVLAAAPLLAQEKPTKVDPRWFLPRDHERIAFVDCARLRDSELWESIERSVFANGLKMLETELGAPLDRVDRLTMVNVPQSREGTGREDDVLLLEGNGPLGGPEPRSGSWEQERIGAYDVFRRSDHWFPQLLLWPRADVRVLGTPDALEPLLTAPQQPGMPCADLMSLLADKQNPLAYVAGSVVGMDGPGVLADLLPNGAWPEDDAPTFFALRAFLNDGDDGGDRHLALRCTIRHATAARGIEATEKAVLALLEKGRKDKRWLLAKKVLDTAIVTRDGIDLHVAFDCGRERDAAGLLGTAIASLAVGFAVALEPQAVEVVAVPVEIEEPPPPPPPAPAGNGDGNRGQGGGGGERAPR